MDAPAQWKVTVGSGKKEQVLLITPDHSEAVEAMRTHNRMTRGAYASIKDCREW